ncbi:zinc finger protein Xfin [Manduca sexta]|uniref:zinc finger protein Xfin n=1 Tax=Manduca sexta TaxID=7130 RepID=UPI00189018F1|nr:zinc finger protein Xfin [Manduca sexta]
MECQTIETNYGECRCCMTKGNHRDIAKEYYYNGIREVFQDLFEECFNLHMVTNSHLSTLICSTCVSRLRDASNFKMMVVSTEKQLMETISKNEDKHTVIVNAKNTTELVELEPLVKVETVKAETSDSEYEISYESDAIVCDPSSKYRSVCVVEREKEFLSRFSHGKLKPLPTRKELHKICPNYVKQLSLLQGMVVTPSAIKNLLSKNSRICLNGEKTYITQKLGLVINTNTILEFSNVIPFKSRACAGFSCFYCPSMFENLSMLRKHSLEHNKTEITKILKTYIPDRLVVNVDVTDLKCSICDEPVSNLNTLKVHLVGVHNKTLYQEYTDRVIPFKLTNNMYECQVCACKFETFGAVERHMNVHYRNYVCSQCGMGFVTQNRLKVHMYNTHVQGKFPCDQCKKVFVTKQKYKTHVNVIHKMLKRFKCIKCSERFTEYFHRQKHMADVHGIAIIQYKCNVCDKSFERRYALSRHMKRDHLEERDHHCSLCSYKCFTSNELTLHMVKHSGEKKFECTICKKCYARKKTLREHMKIHNNDRRFCCTMCGQAFVQKCSLKGHMRTHHMKYNVQ